jgi:RNA polymerase sigma factor (sigma-70 family)
MMADVSVPGTEPRADEDLIAAVRMGETEPYGVLYRRHAPAARRVALQLTRSPAEAEDLTAEAFARILDLLLAGGGPNTAFRAYLLRVVRNGLVDKLRRDGRILLSDDLEAVDPGVPFVDTAVEVLENQLIARALGRLPRRWQWVLWHTEVEGQSLAKVAAELGMTPNAVAALAYRAREGLRQAYLQAHLQETPADDCRTTTARLGAWVRGGLSRRDRKQVDEHLSGCERCRTLALELTDLNSGLRPGVPPLTAAR